MTVRKISSLVKDGDIVKHLHDLGIETSLELLEKTAHPMQRTHLAKILGVDEKTILHWAFTADLLRVKGLKIKEAEFLVLMTDINNIQSLKTKNSEQLYSLVTNINEKKRYLKQEPTIDNIEAWIKNAKSIVPKLLFPLGTEEELNNKIRNIEKKTNKFRLRRALLWPKFFIMILIIFYAGIAFKFYPILNKAPQLENQILAKLTAAYAMKAWFFIVTASWSIILIITFGVIFLYIILAGVQFLQLKFITPRLFPDRTTYLKYLTKSKDAFNIAKRKINKTHWFLFSLIVVFFILMFLFSRISKYQFFTFDHILFPASGIVIFVATYFAILWYLSLKKLKIQQQDIRVFKQADMILSSMMFSAIVIVWIGLIHGIVPLMSWGVHWFVPKVFTTPLLSITKEYQENIHMVSNQETLNSLIHFSNNISDILSRRFVSTYIEFSTTIKLFLDKLTQHFLIPLFLWSIAFMFLPFLVRGEAEERKKARRFFLYAIVSCILGLLLGKYLIGILFIIDSSYFGIVTLFIFALIITLFFNLLPETISNMAKICPFCGFNVLSNQKYCGNCGGNQEIELD